MEEVVIDEMSEYKGETKVEEKKTESKKEKKEKKEKKFGRDDYGRPFQFAENSVPKLVNRETRRRIAKESRKAKNV